MSDPTQDRHPETGERLERLVRIEEQVNGVRSDTKRIETSLTTLINTISTMHLSFVPRPEIEKQIALRDKEMAELITQIKSLEQRAARLEAWRNWMLGAGALLVFLITILSHTIGKWW